MPITPADACLPPWHIEALFSPTKSGPMACSVANWLLACLRQVMGLVRKRDTPMVIDADGLWLVNQNPALVQGGLSPLLPLLLLLVLKLLRGALGWLRLHRGVALQGGHSRDGGLARLPSPPSSRMF